MTFELGSSLRGINILVAIAYFMNVKGPFRYL
jgi:hypothetical protein